MNYQPNILDQIALMDQYDLEQALQEDYMAQLDLNYNRYLYALSLGYQPSVLDFLFGGLIYGQVNPWYRRRQLVRAPSPIRVMARPIRSVPIRFMPRPIRTPSPIRSLPIRSLPIRSPSPIRSLPQSRNPRSRSRS